MTHRAEPHSQIFGCKSHFIITRPAARAIWGVLRIFELLISLSQDVRWRDIHLYQWVASLSSNPRAAARKACRLGKEIPQPGSLRFQKRGRFWRACFASGYRALAVAIPEEYLWFWIGTYDEYERLLREL